MIFTETSNTIVIGSGFTGLGLGLSGNVSILEAKDSPGGICSSYKKNGFKFEIGGGHWIFGNDREALELVERFAKCNRYYRKSAVYFAGNLDETAKLMNTFVEYPIQNNLRQLGSETAKKCLIDIFAKSRDPDSSTMEEWMKHYFGDELCSIFFAPFHEKYTAGLYKEIAPQDPHKSPLSKEKIIEGAFENPGAAVGYNISFIYPQEGLDRLALAMAQRCRITYQSKVVSIDLDSKIVHLQNGDTRRYEKLVSTAPLTDLLRMTGLSKKVGKNDPYTSVLVVNIGAELADAVEARNGNHWIYVPDSSTGFHRVGYYSNVDPIFLPEKMRAHPDKFGSLYVEFAFANGAIPDRQRIEKLCQGTVEELKEWKFIKKELVVDPTIIDVAYTWSYPKSDWISRSINELRSFDIISAGRYGQWKFQGILESLKEGLTLGSSLG